MADLVFSLNLDGTLFRSLDLYLSAQSHMKWRTQLDYLIWPENFRTDGAFNNVQVYYPVLIFEIWIPGLVLEPC